MTQLAKIEFSDDQVKLIKSQIAPKATADELKLFMYQAQRTGLDPLTRQIYCIHRNQRNQDGSYSAKMTIQTSIDGFRVIAERSGDYAGQSEPDFVYEGDKLKCCKIAVFRFRGDVRYQASVGVAYWAEYSQNSGLWTKMPHTMLSKVAEALALRKAYPQDLSGLYTSDEMAQADVVEIKPEPKAQPKPIEISSLNDQDYKDLEYVLLQCTDVESIKEVWDSCPSEYQADTKVRQLFNQYKQSIKPNL
jgi:phage recombination protein Bet